MPVHGQVTYTQGFVNYCSVLDLGNFIGQFKPPEPYFGYINPDASKGERYSVDDYCVQKANAHLSRGFRFYVSV